MTTPNQEVADEIAQLGARMMHAPAEAPPSHGAGGAAQRVLTEENVTVGQRPRD
jgi:hypothetical protein